VDAILLATSHMFKPTTGMVSAKQFGYQVEAALKRAALTMATTAFGCSRISSLGRSALPRS